MHLVLGLNIKIPLNTSSQVSGFLFQNKALYRPTATSTDKEFVQT